MGGYVLLPNVFRDALVKGEGHVYTGAADKLYDVIRTNKPVLAELQTEDVTFTLYGYALGDSICFPIFPLGLLILRTTNGNVIVNIANL